MAKPKKNGTYLNVCIDTDIYNSLSRLCKEAGQTKTVAVERALIEYLENYKRQQQIIASSLASNNNEEGL